MTQWENQVADMKARNSRPSDRTSDQQARRDRMAAETRAFRVRCDGCRGFDAAKTADDSMWHGKTLCRHCM